MLTLLKGSLKIYRWWDSQLPLMLALVYRELYLAKSLPSVGNALLLLVLFLVASIGIAGFGYLMNDLLDREQDRRAGLHNLLARKGRLQVIALFGFVLLVSCLPWYWLPLSKSIAALLAFEFFLFVAYSVPPLRFKERGLLGPAADALYGYTVPMMVSLLVFARLGHDTVPIWFLLLLGAWSLVLGLRHLLIHQLEDVAHDETTGTKTFVTMRGWKTTFTLMERTLFPMEAGLFALLLLALGIRLPLVPIGFLVYLVWVHYRLRTTGIWQEGNPWKLPIIDKLFFLNITVMSRFQTQWLPLLILAPLVARSPFYLVFVVIHLMLFENGFKTLFAYDLPEWRRMRRTA